MKRSIIFFVVMSLAVTAGAAEVAGDLSAPMDYGSPVVAEKYMVSSGHPLATEAGLQILEKGGNAYDAAVAVCMALNVTRYFSAGAVGVSPTLIYDADRGAVRGYNGLGTAPGKATASYFHKQGWPIMPALGINAQILPASPDAWVAILKDYGTMSFGEVAGPAIRLADQGFSMNETVAEVMTLPGWQDWLYKRVWPYNYSVLYEPFGEDGPEAGDVFIQKDLAKTLTILVRAESEESLRTGDREAALDAVRREFYEGEIARAIVASQEKNNGMITMDDLAGYEGHWEEPVKGTYKGYTIWANGPWCQGPTVPMILQILENVDLQSLGHNSAEYVSAVAQAVELAYADREAYFGDPDFVDVPLRGLLSKEYAKERANQINPTRAFGKMPPPGDPWKYEGRPRPEKVYVPKPVPAKYNPMRVLSVTSDTTYLSVIDSDGNAVSLTPSDFPVSPMVEGHGILLGIRGTQFRLKDGHPARVAPYKRPRLTPNPSMVTKDGKLWMSFGTPGGDQQPQAMVQVFLNMVEWGMDPQDAINQPRFKSRNFPDSFSPHLYYPGEIQIEAAMMENESELKGQGYKVEVLPPPARAMGAVCAIRRMGDGTLVGGADPREQALAKGE